jgi:arginine deiminase
MPVGDRTVLMGMSERTSRRVITQVAAAQFPAGAAASAVVTGVPKLRFAAVLPDAEL